MTKDEAIEELRGYKQYCRTMGFRFNDCREALDMAIEALENYDGVVEDLQDCLEKYKQKKAEVKSLKQNKWIPCEERLPEKDEEVFVYLFRNQPYIAWHDGVDWCTEDFTVDKDEEPLAWMPLPKAYEGRTE